MLDSTVSNPTHCRYNITVSQASRGFTSNRENTQSSSMLQRIASLRPFSIEEDEQNKIQGELNLVYTQHRATPEVSPERQITTRPFKTKLSTQTSDFRKMAIAIVRKKTRKKPVIPRSNTALSNRESEEQELATQMMVQEKKESKKFKDTLSRFREKIKEATISFINDNVVNTTANQLEKSGGVGKMVEKKKVRSTYRQQQITDKRTSLYWLNKNDVYTWLKTTNRAINMTRLPNRSRHAEQRRNMHMAQHHSSQSRQASHKDTFQQRYHKKQREVRSQWRQQSNKRTI